MNQELRRGQTVQPERFQVSETGEALSIAWRWFTPRQIVFAAFALLWVSFLVNWYARAGLDSEPGLFALPHAAIGLWLTYSSLAGLLNSTRVVVSSASIQIDHGPLPWFGRPKVRTSDVVQLYCTSQSKSGRRGSIHISYLLHAVGRNGVRQTLLRELEEPEMALWLEQAIEARLALPDQPVDGELATRHPLALRASS